MLKLNLQQQNLFMAEWKSAESAQLLLQSPVSGKIPAELSSACLERGV